MNNVASNQDYSSRPPAEPVPLTCPNCMFVAHIGERHCPNCNKPFPRPRFETWLESDEWHDQNRRNERALRRWQTWQERQSLITVPEAHPRYAAWMAFRCYLLAQVFLRRVDADQVAHIAAVVVLHIELREGCWWFGDVLLDEDLSGDLYAPAHDDKDHAMAGALLSISQLLADPVGDRDDILPGDHAIIKGAF